MDLVDSRARRWKTGKSLRQRLRVAVTEAREFGRVQAEEELKTFDQIYKDLLATNEENRQRREWKNLEKSVKLRREGAVVEWVPNPWLCLPSTTHITLAWNYFGGQFSDWSVHYRYLYGDTKYNHCKTTIDRLMGTSEWTTTERRGLTEAMET